ncbi:DNA polymerase delta subunit 2 [Cymbomonas tetramitiformis]|uniref:DNA polymerase delta subunit 2 n=1 Tax=Cymbomonas tetramitiformis TaxID=36881 RepID=A0AAE0GXX1_9CHLO|nr:DNA polymerase delta subunit 2 [Cymbomonas tetramitiformis]
MALSEFPDEEMAPSTAAGSLASDALMSVPADLETFATPLDRQTAEYKNKSDRFFVGVSSYREQYAQLYFTRLMSLKQRTLEAMKKLSPKTEVTNALDVEEGVEVVLYGVVYKEMKLKPCILDEYAKESALDSKITSSNFTADDDFLVLEDENARIRLEPEEGVLCPENIVTGVIIAVRGRAQQDGAFVVNAVAYPPAIIQRPMPPPSSEASPAPYIALVSGLEIGSVNDPLRTQLLVDHLCGLLGGGQDQELSARVVRVVIAGNSLAYDKEIPTGAVTAAQRKDISASLRELDLSLSQLAAGVPVDVMPGGWDLSNTCMPQQPLHACLFPGASREAEAAITSRNPAQPSDAMADLGVFGVNSFGWS